MRTARAIRVWPAAWVMDCRAVPWTTSWSEGSRPAMERGANPISQGTSASACHLGQLHARSSRPRRRSAMCARAVALPYSTGPREFRRFQWSPRADAQPLHHLDEGRGVLCEPLLDRRDRNRKSADHVVQCGRLDGLDGLDGLRHGPRQEHPACHSTFALNVSCRDSTPSYVVKLLANYACRP